MMPKKKESRQATVVAALVIGFLMIATAIFADYYYDLNDDVLMKDILAGVQTGLPTGYNIQMLYPVSACLAFFYRINRALPWYGLFLCACQWGCLFLFIRRILVLVEKRTALFWGKKMGVLAGVLAASFWAYFGRELVYVQYTVTCAMLAATALFLLYTAKQTEDTALFLKDNTGAVLLLLLAFMLRTEMLLLLLPFLGVAGIVRWTQEGVRATGRYVVLGVGILTGLAVCYGAEQLAYSKWITGDTTWTEFRQFFDARTEVYDFYGIPSYEEHADFYESLGLKEAEWELLENYNFGLSDKIDGACMKQIADYAGKQYYREHPWQERARVMVWEYVHRMLPLPESQTRLFVSDMPWNLGVWFLYLSLVAVAVWHRRDGHQVRLVVEELVLLVAARTVSWGYVLFRGRMPERISHGLYLMEMAVLLAFLVGHMRQGQGVQEAKKNGTGTGKENSTGTGKENGTENGKGHGQEQGTENSKVMRFTVGLWVAFGIVLFVISLPYTGRKIWQEGEARLQTNAAYEELQAYCQANAEHYYYVDVRSTVYFSEKMFEKVDNSKRNYDIIGGWACKSPVAMKEAVTYFVTQKDKPVDWLNRLSQEQGGSWEPVLEEKTAYWDIYRIQSDRKAW